MNMENMLGKMPEELKEQLAHLMESIDIKPEIDRQWNETKEIRISFMGVLGCAIVDTMSAVVRLEQDDPDYAITINKLKLLLETRELLERSVSDE